MKHLILICSLLIGSFLTVTAQNGGQYPENNSVKLEYLGGGQIKITNKQTCSSVIRLNDSQTEGDFTIPGNSFVIYILPSNLLTNIHIKAKNTTNCGATDFGWVELFLASLPLQFTSFTVNKEYTTLYTVKFNIADPVNVDHYLVMVSTDFKTWVKRDSISHDPYRKNYSSVINFKK